MATLSQLDINVRLQISNCCYSSMALEYAKDLKWGRKCKEENRRKLVLLGILIDILNSYQVGEDDNCYTEDEIQDLIKNIEKLTGICFKPIGYSYEIAEGYILDEETGTLVPE